MSDSRATLKIDLHTPIVQSKESADLTYERMKTRSMQKAETRSMVRGLKNRKRKLLRKSDYTYGTKKGQRERTVIQLLRTGQMTGKRLTRLVRIQLSKKI